VLGFLALAASAGFASLLTPCVLPVLPLTAGYLAGRRRQSGSAPVVEAGLFAAGIVVTFSALGLALATLVGASGVNRIAANPWLNLFVAALFIAFALSLLGLYSLRIPSGLLTRADSAARQAPRVLAPLLAGVAFTLATFACTAPFVGPLLVAASAGEWVRPLVGMLVYSSAFALPFVLLGVMPRWLDRLPKPGPWMTDVRVAIAALQLAAALTFIANAGIAFGWRGLGREIVLGLWVALALALAAFVLVRAGGWPRLSAGRATAGVLPVVAALWLAGGMSGRSMGELEALLPSRAAPQSAALPWIVNDVDAALVLARAEGRPVFVDFTGYTCGNCRWMESNVFTRESVHAALQPFVLLRLYTDGDGPVFARNQALQEARFGTVALPLYAVLDTNGEPRDSFVGVARDVQAFVRFIKRGNRY
jgi:thiol:disulfide interchange protein